MNEINCNVILDNGLPTKRRVSFCIKEEDVYETNGHKDWLNYSDDALEVFKHISTSNLKRTVRELKPKEKIHKLGLVIIRLYV